MNGRYAPSPSGRLHIGNLRTAMLAWLLARSSGRGFLLRFEDLDRVARGAEDTQLADLAAIGIDWDLPVLHQSARGGAYDDIIDDLRGRGLTYECYCTRREILEAASAPHQQSAPDGAYPGTCRGLTDAERAAKAAGGRPPAIRLRAEATTFTVHDQFHGAYTGAVDDFVLRRGDGTPAYNLAVVVDDAHQQVDQVVRGDDLLSSAPRQAYLASLLGHPVPTYAHVPMILNTDGIRLAKRDGAITLPELADRRWPVGRVVSVLAASLGLPARESTADLLADFDPAALPQKPWLIDIDTVFA
ncbi:tRNA glutamyl-Q(34) synthetase GluQRS [Jongsikchunia kroppenstedtii]|uniref:tRNA glutamyl-Q(34) synthetase GluQRS n=1 Tax=Jongsikchunia kroppenstedtii TaxID=1121721 RepID=UPI000475952D|nr:tRNA glutamyl-Q(34) synthetase GluQRS [Jongsikchunia kroppenstedtii]